MTFLTESTRNPGFRRTLIAGAIGAVALDAAAAPALAEVLGYYYAQPTTVYAPAPTYSYTYTYTEPANTYVAPAQPPTGTTMTTTTTYNSVVTAPTAPPPPRAEVIPPRLVRRWCGNLAIGASMAPPGTGSPGHYEAAPQPTAQWIPGHLTQQPGGSWVWIAGRWTT